MIAQPSLSRLIYNRELGRNRQWKQPYLDQDREIHLKLSGSTFVAPTGSPSMPYAISFCKHIDHGHLLATSCEDGFVSIIDASKKLPSYITGEEGAMPRAHWQAHRNAVFDVVWAQNDRRLLTPSGDRTVGIWDVTTASLVSCCQGHTGSIKSVCPLPSNEEVFATGSRDGAIMLWDTRSPTVWSSWLQRRVLAPSWEMHDAHSIRHPVKTPPSGRGGGRKDRASGLPQSITSVVFIPHTNLLASSGSGDTTVKLWDMRKACAPVAALQASAGTPGLSPCALTPPALIRPPGLPPCSSPGAVSRMTASFSCRGSGPFGVTCMAASHQGSKLLVNCTDSRLYMFDILSAPSEGPRAVFSGHHTPPGSNSFYVKCGFSPDGSRVICGSMDEKAYIWEVGRPLRPPAALVGHERPGVCAVAWSHQDPSRVATASDDISVKLWELQLGDLRPALSPPEQPTAGTPLVSSSQLTPLEDTLMSRQNAATVAVDGETSTPLATLAAETPAPLSGMASFLRRERECGLVPSRAPSFSLAPFPSSAGALPSPVHLTGAAGPSLSPAPLHHAALAPDGASPRSRTEAETAQLEHLGDGGREISLAPGDLSHPPPPLLTTSSSNSSKQLHPSALPSSPSLMVRPGALLPKPVRSAISPLMSRLRGASGSQGAPTAATPTMQQKEAPLPSGFAQSPVLRLAFDLAGCAAIPSPEVRAHTAAPTDPPHQPSCIIPQDGKRGTGHVAVSGSPPPPDADGPLCEAPFDEDDDKENIDPAKAAGLAAMAPTLPPSSPMLENRASIVGDGYLSTSPPPPPAEEPAAVAARVVPSDDPAARVVPSDDPAAIALVTLVAPLGFGGAQGPNTALGSASSKRPWQPPPDGAASCEGSEEREAKRRELDVAQEETEATAGPSPAPAKVASYSWGRDSQVPCLDPFDEDSRPLSGCANSPLLTDALACQRKVEGEALLGVTMDKQALEAWAKRQSKMNEAAASGRGVVGDSMGGGDSVAGGPSGLQLQCQQQIMAHLDAASRCAWEPGMMPSATYSDSEDGAHDSDSEDDYDDYSDDDDDDADGDRLGGGDADEDLGPGVFLLRGYPPAGPPPVREPPPAATPLPLAARGDRAQRPKGPKPPRATKPRGSKRKLAPVSARKPPDHATDAALRASKVKQRTLFELWGGKGKEEGKHA